MKMSIDEAENYLIALKHCETCEANGTNICETCPTYKRSSSVKCYDAIDVVIDTIHKYQKIQEIVKQKDYDGFNSHNYHGCFLRVQDIIEVLEDGNDD